MVKARADITDERRVLIVESMHSLIELRDRKATQGLLSFEEEHMDARMDTLLSIFTKHPGNCPVKLKVMMESKEVQIVLKDKRDVPVSVLPSEGLCDEVEQLFGKPLLSFI